MNLVSANPQELQSFDEGVKKAHIYYNCGTIELFSSQIQKFKLNKPLALE